MLNFGIVGLIRVSACSTPECRRAGRARVAKQNRLGRHCRDSAGADLSRGGRCPRRKQQVSYSLATGAGWLRSSVGAACPGRHSQESRQLSAKARFFVWRHCAAIRQFPTRCSGAENLVSASPKACREPCCLGGWGPDRNDFPISHDSAPQCLSSRGPLAHGLVPWGRPGPRVAPDTGLCRYDKVAADRR
jgi:hypothetical protein